MERLNVGISILVFIIILSIGVCLFQWQNSKKVNLIFVDGDESFFDSWTEREDVIYKNIFPNIDRNIYVPKNGNDITGGEKLVNSRWGVFEIAPSNNEKYYRYVTSGISNPFKGEKIEGLSGFGYELEITTKEKSPWAIKLLFNLMGNILESGARLSTENIIPLKVSIDGNSEHKLSSIVTSYSDEYDYSHELKSGKFNILHITGTTKEEEKYGQEYGVKELIKLLKFEGVLEVTDNYRHKINLPK